MGHKEGHTLAYNHRMLAAAQRKIGSFILVFAVMVIAWVVFLAAIHNRETSCQLRSHEARFQNVLPPSLTLDEIMNALQTVFDERKVELTISDAHGFTFNIDLLDTETDLLMNNGFRLLRWRDKSWIKWDLRSFSFQMCDAAPPVSMEILPNVDYEKAQYRSIALQLPHMENHTLQYMLTSQLRTTDDTRISSFVQLESVFPGFYALSSADDKVVVRRTYKMTSHGVIDVYFQSMPLDVAIQIQQWESRGAALFWTVSLSSTDIQAQTALVSLQRSLQNFLSEKNLMCRDRACLESDAFGFLLLALHGSHQRSSSSAFSIEEITNNLHSSLPPGSPPLSITIIIIIMIFFLLFLMAANTIENAGVHYGSHLRMDAERNYNMEVAKDEMARAIGIKGDPITLYPLLDEYEQDIEIDKATKPPCYLTAGDVKGLLCSGHTSPRADGKAADGQTKAKRGSRKMKEGWEDEEEEEEEDQDVEVIEPAPGEEEQAKEILLKNPRCQYEFNVILALLQKQRRAREAFEAVEDCARNSLADVWSLQWEEMFELATESQRRAVDMKRDRLARDYRMKRLQQRREEVEKELTEREAETVFHTEEMLRELDGVRGVELWKEQLESYFYNNPLYALEYEEKKQIEAVALRDRVGCLFSLSFFPTCSTLYGIRHFGKIKKTDNAIVSVTCRKGTTTTTLALPHFCIIIERLIGTAPEKGSHLCLSAMRDVHNRAASTSQGEFRCSIISFSFLLTPFLASFLYPFTLRDERIHWPFWFKHNDRHTLVLPMNHLQHTLLRLPSFLRPLGVFAVLLFLYCHEEVTETTSQKTYIIQQSKPTSIKAIGYRVTFSDMSFQANFSFGAERTAKELRRFLSIPPTPLRLHELHRLRISHHEEILRYTKELAVRTARSYAAFFDPVVQNCLEKVPRLPWAREVSLREFQYCVHLQDVAERYVEEKNLLAADENGADQASNDTILNCGSSFGLLKDERILRHRPHDVLKQVSTHFYCDTYTSPMRAKIISALQRGEISLSSLPFETALALLRPEHSLLHVLVNETHIDYLPLNLWFSNFCQRRVAWRVLHEHLLHVIQPVAFPYVIADNADVLDLVYHAADVVMGIHSARPIANEDEVLQINATLDPSILQSIPTAPLVSSSRSCPSGPYKIPPSEPALLSPPSSSKTYAVDSHLKYVFRELLKNAYAAMVAHVPQVEIDVRAAQDGQWYTVDVSDRGHGINPTYENDIWRFGFTTSADSESILEGFGVGLPTSKVYMDLWGGYMEAYSTEGGTTMRVRFPKMPTEVLVPDEGLHWAEERLEQSSRLQRFGSKETYHLQSVDNRESSDCSDSPPTDCETSAMVKFRPADPSAAGAKRRNTFSRQHRRVAPPAAPLQNDDAMESGLEPPSSALRHTPSPSRDHKRRRSLATCPAPLSPTAGSTRSLSDDSVYSGYDFVNDVIQDILLNQSDDEEERVTTPTAPLAFFSPFSSSRRRQSTSLSSSHLSDLPLAAILQPKKKRKKGPKLLLARPSQLWNFSLSVVLDMDETLLAARGAGVYIRPHVPEFIHTCHALRCEVIVWTAGTTAYANGLFAEIAAASRMELWYHHAITRHPRWFEETVETNGLKDIRRLQRDTSKVLVIENNPASILKQPENALLVEDYTEPNPNDRTFQVLKEVLEEVVSLLSRPTTRTLQASEAKPGVPAALLRISQLAQVQVGEVGTNLSTHALWYSPAPKGEPRQYGGISSHNNQADSVDVTLLTVIIIFALADLIYANAS
eukprot:gene4403-3203_t